MARCIRLWLSRLLLPPGYAIWTWDDDVFEDEPVVAKDAR